MIILYLLPLAIRNFLVDCKLEWKHFGKERSRVLLYLIINHYNNHIILIILLSTTIPQGDVLVC